MRENRPYGSEGGARTNPPRSYPYPERVGRRQTNPAIWLSEQFSIAYRYHLSLPRHLHLADATVANFGPTNEPGSPPRQGLRHFRSVRRLAG
jgi:hypothetical protein